MFSIKSGAVLVIALVAAIAAPWIRVFATCPTAPSGECSTVPHESDCPCSPEGGYKSCDGWPVETCESKTGHHIENGNWSCKTNTGTPNQQCVYGSTTQCWVLLKCKWSTNENKCIKDDGSQEDNSNLVDKKQEECRT
jgi:hypothetical protein